MKGRAKSQDPCRRRLCAGLTVAGLTLAGLAGWIGAPGWARGPSDTDPLSAFRWDRRLVLVFAPAADTPALVAQGAGFESLTADLMDRDMTVITVLADTVLVGDERQQDMAAGLLRRRYRIDPDAVTTVLIGKDGTEKGRWPAPVRPDTLFALIDTMPMRRREMEQRR